MKIDEYKIGDVMVVLLYGSLDIETYRLVREKLLGLVDCGETEILVDLSAVDFMTSSGLSALIWTKMKLEKESGKFAVCSLSTNVMKVFTTSGFNSIIITYPSADIALEDMS